MVPPVPGLEYQVQSYAAKIRALSLIWVFYAAYSMLAGVAGLTFLRSFFANHFGTFGHSPWGYPSFPNPWLGPFILHAAWASLLVRVALALIAAWGLHERSQWGRIVAIVAAFFNILHFPFGTALAIGTLVILLGYRNSSLYEQLAWNPGAGPGA
jgi:hypothetical protein